MILALRLSFIMLLLCYFQIKSERTESYSFKAKIKNAVTSVKKSFNTFYGKVLNFIKKPFVRIEKMRRKIKKAFHLFIDESKSSFNDYSKANNKIEYSNNVVPEMPLFELIEYQNFRMETHMVLTKDGYMLTIHRIMSSSSTSNISKKIVLLHHGLWGSTTDWIILGPKKGLPYLLLKSGYDVWLANARGNKYSNSHVSKATDSAEYWNFSWHEMGLYDMSSIIDYMMEITQGKSEIVVIAYSMGATALLVLLSSLPQYNNVLSLVILIAPLVYMNHVEGPIQYLANVYSEDDLSFLNSSTADELIPGGIFPDGVKEKFCKGNEAQCSNILLLLGNGGRDLSNDSNMAKILNNIPASSSKKTMFHYLQLIRSRKFQTFDYGSANIIIYGSESPKPYELSKITVPVIIINSVDDWLSNVKDIANLVAQIPVVNHIVIQKKDFSHLDFMWGSDAADLVYSPILGSLNHFFK